ncbi:MAG: ribose-phosphate pyrophosphokinase [Lachnospiraceae bacterium]|nr:ribose-phosphate pyrophosphokinase [Lachnospiraceae bacterium]
MSGKELFATTLPVAPMKIAALESCSELAEKVNAHLVEFRKSRTVGVASELHFNGYFDDSFLVKTSCVRFGSGEAKGMIKESIRGTDLYIMVDVGNYSLTYTVCGHENHMSPDDHYQDLKRIIAASTAGAHRVTVIMPFLYEGRQHKRTKRESLDCALALEELVDMGVSNIITFDAHDPRVVNAIPLHGFDNFTPAYQFIKAILHKVPDLHIDSDHLMIISPDEGAMNRAVYFANVLGVDMGMFYKRRDYSVIVNGKNPIVEHEFLGNNVEGKDVIVIDDMISSGESMLDVAKELKNRKANRIFVCTTFGLFTDGLAKFDEYYEKGYISYVVTTNLTYRSEELLSRPYYIEADMSKFLAMIIDSLNHDIGIGNVLEPTKKIQALLEQYEKQLKKTL